MVKTCKMSMLIMIISATFIILLSSSMHSISQGFTPTTNNHQSFKPLVLRNRRQKVNQNFFLSSRIWGRQQDFMTATSSERLSCLLAGNNSNEINSIKQGSIVALVTPFKSNGDIDIVAIRKLLKFHVISQTNGICILGTTGEASLLSLNERRVILETAVEEVKGKIPIIAGTGSINPTEVQEMTLQARDIGCDACLVVSPPYVKPPQRGLIRHFTSVADLGLPVIIYNVPDRTGVDMKPESIALCANHDNIVGVKEATGDLRRIRCIRSLTYETRKDRPLLLYSGDDATSAQFVLNGGDGCISVTANIAPIAVHKLMMAALQGNKEKVKCINEEHEMLNCRIFCEANPIPVKWALKRMGQIENSYCRPPLMELNEKYYKYVEEAMEISGVI